MICEKREKINKRSFLFLILFLFSTTLISLRTLKKVYIQDIRIYGTDIFSQNDVVINSSLKLPIRLILIETNFLEKELKKNLSLKNVSIRRQIFPFGLKVEVNTRIPIAYAEAILNDEKISGFIDKNGIFIKKRYAEEKNWPNLSTKVYGWKEKYKKTLSEVLNAQDNYDFEIVKITFSQNGFLTVEEKDLKTIFLGFNLNLINHQLRIISKLKNKFKENNFYEKIDNIDLTNPKKPKIKVFKP